MASDKVYRFIDYEGYRKFRIGLYRAVVRHVRSSQKKHSRINLIFFFLTFINVEISFLGLTHCYPTGSLIDIRMVILLSTIWWYFLNYIFEIYLKPKKET